MTGFLSWLIHVKICIGILVISKSLGFYLLTINIARHIQNVFMT